RPCDGLALAGHGDAALAGMSPPGDEIEIARVGVESAGNGGEHAADAQCRTDWREVHAWQALFDIEQRGDLTPERGGRLKRRGAGRQGNTGPVLPQRAGVLASVERRVKYGHTVIEEVCCRVSVLAEECLSKLGEIW